MKILTALMILISLSAEARLNLNNGGMIGGGEVSFKPILTCDLEADFPTFSDEVSLHIVYEVGFDGRRIQEANLTVITVDSLGKLVNALPSTSQDLIANPDGSFGLNLALTRYDDDRATTISTGTLLLDKYLMSGRLKSKLDYVQSADLTNCFFF